MFEMLQVSALVVKLDGVSVYNLYDAQLNSSRNV